MKFTAAHLTRFKSALAHGVVALLFGLGTGQALATQLNISDKPLDTLEGVPANILLTMDDSGSMRRSYMPETIEDNDNTRRAKSSTFNKVYYNPAITYIPAEDKSGASLGNATFTAAWLDGFDRTTTDDLSSGYCAWWNRDTTCARDSDLDDTDVAAFYYVFDPSNTKSGGAACTMPTDVNVDACYDRVTITSGTTSYSPVSYTTVFQTDNNNSSGSACTLPTDVNDAACYKTSNRSDCAAATCTFAEESQNFANWYSYYHSRSLLARTAVTLSFSELSTSVRVSWQQLNTDIDTLAEIPDTLPFDSTHRTNFFDWIEDLPTSGSTPLTDATDRAGQKFSQDSVYRKDPADNTSTMYSCRQNFHFAFTDGYWNDNSVSLGNYDNTERDLPDGVHYDVNTSQVADQAPPIYRDGNSTFLADIAMKYWATDLNTNVDNNVPPFITDVSTDIDGDGDNDSYDEYWNPANDPATWQHMVNFTVGLGVEGVLPFTDATYEGLIDGSVTWPTTGTDNQHHVDDLWHAAINSRGRPFNARDTQELLDGFNEVLQNIDSRIGSSSAVATTSSQYQTGTNLFQAIYDPSTWSGDLVAKDVITLTEQWSAADVLAAQIDGSINSPRKILTFDPGNNGGGIPFQWDDLTNTQKTDLRAGDAVAVGEARLDYLRGDKSNEVQSSGTYQFRNREKALGDVVHSDPIFIPPPGAPLFFWPDNLESVAYSTFVASKSGRQDMVLFGSNDGMLHIVNAFDGREILAYVPNLLMPNLSALTDPAYSHQFYVDHAVQVSDVFFGGSWHTVAIGGLGKGGKGIYALDITNPSNFLESNAANLVLWEYTDADLGYSYTKPQIFKMNNNKWVAAINNGYNSGGDGNAEVILLDIEDGSVIANGQLDTLEGTADDPTGAGRPNRLTDVVAVDQNNDFKVDFLYAGDLFGNLWKFDVSDSNPQKWGVYGDAQGPEPLLKARDDNDNPQPITVPPVIQYHNSKNGFMIFVGAGKYLEVSDISDTSMQTVYGVWDREEAINKITTINRASLLEQKIEGANRTQFTKSNARVTTANTMKWYDGKGLPTGNPINQFLGWYMDLGDIDNNGNPVAKGERVVDELFVSGDRLEFITLIPSTDPCLGGGESWIFAINAFTGSRFTSNTPWDYNFDGKYDSADKVEWGGGKVWGSGINLKTPQRFRRTKLLEPGADCQEVNLLNNADGTISTVSGSCQGYNYGRRSWRQLQIQ